MDTVSLLTGLAFLAAFNEWAIEFFLGQWKNPTLNKFLIYVAAAIGVAEAFALKLNALPLAGVEGNVTLGYLITGIVIGAGSNFVHKFFGKTIRGG